MRTALIIITTFVFLASCGPSEKDSVAQAQELNQNSAIDEDISKFLTEAADARMMGVEQGKLAMAKGTTPAIKQYGEWMVNDQTRMLKEIRVLAASKNIMLPNSLSNKKADGLKDLKEKEGQDFDDKFIKMMTTDHKRDVNEFDDATDFKDKDVQKFAATYLPIVESHLEKIKAVEENESVAGQQ
jgi:putative membrane protein